MKQFRITANNATFRAYANAFFAGKPRQYVGHNPAARIRIALLVLLFVQSATNLVLAGTDFFWPTSRIPV
jgi:Ni/Fe-hydrogenase 1 B-type cytochrome subunit